jgi:hypothetical protein
MGEDQANGRRNFCNIDQQDQGGSGNIGHGHEGHQFSGYG